MLYLFSFRNIRKYPDIARKAAVRFKTGCGIG